MTVHVPRGVGVVALCVILGACGEASPSSASADQAQRAIDVQGPFQLVFELPRTTFRAGEVIEGRATLGVVGAAPVAFGSSGSGPFVFEFAEIGGRRQVGGAMAGDCAPYQLDPGRPMTSGIGKTGGYSPDDPDAAFYREFLLTGSPVTLPAGDWRITAAASLVEGRGCSGAIRNLAAPIVIHVNP